MSSPSWCFGGYATNSVRAVLPRCSWFAASFSAMKQSEALAALTREPEGVTYAEVDAGGVPALWCIPQGCDNDSVLLHCHAGGTVVTSMNTDRKAAGHLAKAAGIRALVLDYRRSPENKFPAQPDDVETAYRWLLSEGYRAEKIASGGHSVGGNLAVGLA